MGGEFSDFPNDINFSINYLDPEKHLRVVYEAVRKLYPTHILVPMGWSAGAHLAYGFASLFECGALYLFDPVMVSPAGLKVRLQFYTNFVKKHKLTPLSLVEMLRDIREHPTENAVIILHTLGLQKISQWVLNKLTSPISCPTMSFINLNSQEDADVDPDATNKVKLTEVAYLKRNTMYRYRVFVDEDHQIYAQPTAQKVILRCVKKMTDRLDH